MKAMHNEKLVHSGHDCVGGKMEHSGRLYADLRRKYNVILEESGYLKGAPFLWVGIELHYGLKSHDKVKFRRIDKKYGDLDIVKQIDMRLFLMADVNDRDLVRDLLEIATLDMLILAGKKYKRPLEAVEKERALLGEIPQWDPRMQIDPWRLFQAYDQTLPEHLRKPWPERVYKPVKFSFVTSYGESGVDLKMNKRAEKMPHCVDSKYYPESRAEFMRSADQTEAEVIAKYKT